MAGLFTKWIKGTDMSDVERQYNDFILREDVFVQASQTHVNLGEFVVVIFYAVKK